MNPIAAFVNGIALRALDKSGGLAERAFVPLDVRLMRRNRNLALIPRRSKRTGGKISYGEWAWVIGLMQSLMSTELDNRQSPTIVDLGCGSGLVAIAAEPLLGSDGRLVGLDVAQSRIDFCRSHYPDSRFEFRSLATQNASYAPANPSDEVSWPIESGSVDLVTALSVWTHLNPATAAASLSEAARVLRPQGSLIASFFLTSDEQPNRATRSRYHRTSPTEWNFDQEVEPGFLTPSWTTVPEQAIAVSRDQLDAMSERAGLQIKKVHSGYWRENAGLYFQDIVIFNKL